jgi:hypothetical protein
VGIFVFKIVDPLAMGLLSFTDLVHGEKWKEAIENISLISLNASSEREKMMRDQNY